MPYKHFSPALRRLIRAYPSLNLKMNISPSRNEMDIVLPGLRYDDIDFTGQPEIWRMFDIVNRVEHAAFFNIPSFLDYLDLYKQNFTTITKACKIEIVSDFYETTTPKAPLDVSIRVCHIGNTSFTTQCGIACGGSMSPVIKIQNTHTLLHSKENKVESLPDWWKHRFEVKPEWEIKPPNVLQPVKPSETFTHTFGVPLGDTDVTHITRCASYVRYFIENASIASKLGCFTQQGKSFHEFHIKRLYALYIAPSCWGDRLASQAWEDEDALTLHCQICRDEDKAPVWYGKLELYPEVFWQK